MLAQQAQGILGNVNTNLERNILPGVRAQMRAAGGYGDSRTGIAEGLAISGANRDATNAITDLLGRSYEADMGRDVQRYGIDTGASTARYGTDTAAATSRYGTDVGAGTAREGFRNASDIARLNAETSRYGIDTGAATSRYGVDAQTGLGYAGLTTPRGMTSTPERRPVVTASTQTAM
jgi:hypothetical protein